jgi:hypothetical protein
MATCSIGDRFNNLTIIEFKTGFRPSGLKKYISVCRCDCGGLIEVETHNLKSGNTRWCQKCSSKHKSNHRKTHGHSEHRKHIEPEGYRAYYIWQAIKRRCFNKNDNRFKDYGGRGITVCKRWADNYQNFLSDMGLPPTRNHQIDRIDNNGNYEPSNCRWVTQTQNSRNKRNNRLITAFGKTQTLVEWEEETGIAAPTIRRRIDKYCKTAEEAVSVPPKMGRGI